MSQPGKRYVPERGDVVWLNFNPQTGHEQAGRRPALVISPASYNHKVGLALFLPITKQVKGYPFEVSMPADGKVSGVILADQVKSLDWQKRNVSFITQLPSDIMNDAVAKLKTLI